MTHNILSNQNTAS